MNGVVEGMNRLQQRLVDAQHRHLAKVPRGSPHHFNTVKHNESTIMDTHLSTDSGRRSTARCSSASLAPSTAKRAVSTSSGEAAHGAEPSTSAVMQCAAVKRRWEQEAGSGGAAVGRQRRVPHQSHSKCPSNWRIAAWLLGLLV